MGNVWGKGDSKGKKSAKVSNTNQDTIREDSLIHSDKGNENAVERIGKSLTVVFEVSVMAYCYFATIINCHFYRNFNLR